MDGEQKFAGKLADVPMDERQRTPMHRAFYENTGTVVHKWRHYLEHYDHHLARFRGTPFCLLELGVDKGGSLRMWRQYFGEQATIFGVDVNPDCKRYDGEAAQVRIGSQADEAFLRSVVSEMGGIDVVIDDGSHVAQHQAASFEVLFPILRDGGVYLCEDTHTAYWRGNHEGGFRRAGTFIEKSKALIDDLHAEFHNKGESFPGASRTISGIHFYNSVVVIDKARQLPSVHLKVGDDD